MSTNGSTKLFTLAELRGSYDISALVGDININTLGSGNDIANEYLNALYEEGYISTINTNTRKQGGTVSCLDHIFVTVFVLLPGELILQIITQLSLVSLSLKEIVSLTSGARFSICLKLTTFCWLRDSRGRTRDIFMT
ncbi:hypothetical protein HHI36_007271, partial [Cryptolaemus montrouzieri]